MILEKEVTALKEFIISKLHNGNNGFWQTVVFTRKPGPTWFYERVGG